MNARGKVGVSARRRPRIAKRNAMKRKRNVIRGVELAHRLAHASTLRRRILAGTDADRFHSGHRVQAGKENVQKER